MRLHLFAFASTLAFDTLFYLPVAASNVVLAKRNLNPNEGYRCGYRVFTKKFLEQATREAINANDLVNQYISQNKYVGELRYPTLYNGPLDFNSNDKLFLWSLSELVQSPSDTETYSLVLGSDPIRIVGVIRQQKKVQTMCIKEPDVSDVYDQDFASGCRCPTSIFSFRMIEKSILDAKKYNQNKPKIDGGALNPSPLDGSPIFDEKMNLFSWPILTDGRYSYRAATSIIMDEYYRFVGMAYKKDDVYSRCVLTISDHIVPRFIGQALASESPTVYPKTVDVFECNGKYISSVQVLKAATSAPNSYIQKSATRQRGGFPQVYFSPPMDSILEKLFIWPIRINEKGESYKPVRFSSAEKYYAVIDEFSNVDGVVFKMDSVQFLDCPRKLVDEHEYFTKMLTNSYTAGATRGNRKSKEPKEDKGPALKRVKISNPLNIR